MGTKITVIYEVDGTQYKYEYGGDCFARFKYTEDAEAFDLMEEDARNGHFPAPIPTGASLMEIETVVGTAPPKFTRTAIVRKRRR